LINELTMGSLFDGVAMFPLAAERNGIKAVWASEIEKFPIAVSKHHFPDMKHLGDICGINGAEIEPVDIITFSSPCQDLSVAGKRAGLAGERSGLFSEAVRIIKEMRAATNGEYPKCLLFENVYGLLSSNKGQDFRTVLEEITTSEIPMPKSGKWANAGMVRGDWNSVAWRVCDAQYWGVAQRRKRIFLVADFRNQRAGEILFECESMSGDFAESGEARKETAGSVGDGVETTIYGFYDRNSAKARSDGMSKNISPTMKAENSGGMAIAHPIGDGCLTPWDGQGNRIVSPDGVSPALRGGGERGYPAFNILHPKATGAICASGAGTNRPAGQGNETDLVFVIQSATMSGNKKQNGLGVSDGPCYTLDCRADHAVAHAVDVRNLVENEELSGTLQSKQTGGYSLNYQNSVRVGYAVRRLMPIECERLMAMPDGWTDIPGASDTARYKAIGNSLVMLIPNWIFSQIRKLHV